MDITNTYRLYAECVSGGAITEPTGGSWISAICIWQGSTEPLNASWLQRHCDNLGITAPLNSSWLIALANYYGETAPINGTWANAILVGCGAVPTDLIWNLTTTEWQDETTNWKTATAPVTPTITTGPDYTTDLPLFQGTAEANNTFTLTVDGTTYNGTVDGTGNWSVQTTTAIAGSSGGTAYTVDIFTFRASDGLTSATLNAPITITVTTTTLVVQLLDSYGDGWNGGAIAFQKETSPGVWELVEYNGNPYYYINQTEFSSDLPANRQYYKQKFYGLYGLTFNEYEYGVSTGGVTPFPTTPASRIWLDTLDIRTITLEPGFNYRTLAWYTGNFAEERSYNIKNGATTIASFGPDGSQWAQDTVQTTFTL